MQDRFKFRVWNTRKKEMLFVYSFDESFIKASPDFVVPSIRTFRNDDCILMQCTGLKDKNGKLIYEGDIVKQSDGCIGFITWQGVSYWVESPGSCARDLESAPYYETVEVIGNIYENPELLEVQNG